MAVGGLWQEQARLTPLMRVVRRTRESAVHVEADRETLLRRLLVQNFVSVIDDHGAFIGIVRRRAVLEHLAQVTVCGTRIRDASKVQRRSATPLRPQRSAADRDR